MILIKYKNSSSYVQRQIDVMLQSFKDFIKIYVDDIIIYFHILFEHVEHLIKMFDLFCIKRVNLASIKFFLNYSSIILLNQWVNSFDMLITIDKVAAITLLRFSINLKNLDHFLDFTDYFKSSISKYAQKVNSFQKKKTTLTRQLFIFVKDSTRKRKTIKIHFYEFIYEKRRLFEDLQGAFSKPRFFIHFNKLPRLYVDLDVSKQWKFAIIIYHVLKNSTNDVIYSKISIQSIMFLNRYLNDAERNYWFIELKIANIIWIMRKIRHMIEVIEILFIIIYTDYSVAMSISRQINFITFSTNKLNLRLMKVSQYLFSFNLIIKYKSSKFNIISNALFRLQRFTIKTENKIEILKSFYNTFIELCHENVIDVEVSCAISKYTFSISEQFFAYHIILIKMTNDFKQKLKQMYIENHYWNKILDMLKTDETFETDSTFTNDTQHNNRDKNDLKQNIRFKHRNDLIYYIVDDDRERLCVF